MPSPSCEVKDASGSYASTVDGVDVTPGDTITIHLADVSGVRYWSIACIGTDETLVAATITASLTIDQGAKTATFTAPAAGKALIFRSTVGIAGLGLDANGASDSSLTTTFGIYTLTSGSLRVGAVNETTEGSASFGWTPKLNAAIRGGGGGGDDDLAVTNGTGTLSTNIGISNNATGDYSACIGGYNAAAGRNAAALGDSNTANGLSAIAMGQECQATSDLSIATGRAAATTIGGQQARASFAWVLSPNPVGGAQTSMMTVGCQLLGAGTQELAINELLLDSSKTYLFDLALLVTQNNVSTGSPVSAMWKKHLLVSVDSAGAITIVGQANTVTPIADTGAAAWTLAISVGSTPTRLKIEVTTDVAARAIGRLEWVETIHA